ncbi:MAG: hypothetical protein DME82_11475 [Verrucomicrobia bacterium]|nr:MAG: hypothetical protein DMC60_01830 [Verrucomicrobiota bacterium]PYI71880.1 MAG: hypothetical protein DMF02_05190 [Verrucomicrobiota bacterium]PYJ54403.1 MAG: hypothetical protein DME82_11475 [Verrucomicrobiota bacterium]
MRRFATNAWRLRSSEIFAKARACAASIDSSSDAVVLRRNESIAAIREACRGHQLGGLFNFRNRFD